MQMYDNLAAAETTYGGCCTIDDLADARRVAWKLGIPHFTLNLEANFHEKVVAPFVRSYLAGTTPSPCVLCNTHVKFDLFHQKARAIGAAKIATGHYARITDGGGRLELRRARDLAKDQSYFLFELSQAQLGEALFPLGELTKPEVRALAEEAGLSVARKKESYEICFVPEKDGYAKVVEREAGIAPGQAAGEIVDLEGNVVGMHDGYYQFTIGQRRGLQVGGSAARTYVVGGAGALDRRRITGRPRGGAGPRPLADGRCRCHGHASRRGSRARRVRSLPASGRSGSGGGVLPGRSVPGRGVDRAVSANPHTSSIARVLSILLLHSSEQLGCCRACSSAARAPGKSPVFFFNTASLTSAGMAGTPPAWTTCA
jgi:hypothetical protein